VPFVLGPLNGGVPWPRGFDAARRREREFLSYVRGAHRWLPGHRSTLRHASAVLVGSRDTLAQVPATRRDKCVYLPENAVDPERFGAADPRSPSAPLRVVFVGRLVPYKGADMLIEAAAPLARSGAIRVEIIGDGPMREELDAMIRRDGLDGGLTLTGWVDHADLPARLREADVLAFPSIREFGGGVVLEAMASGVVPVVVDYGGPAELVTEDTGFLIPIGPRDSIVSAMRATLGRLVERPEAIPPLAARGRERVERLFTWPAKARQVLEVYRWITGERSDKPDYGMPLSLDRVSQPQPRPVGSSG
jgi:glycosyltransferase involved in cell wall biosynthesis